MDEEDNTHLLGDEDKDQDFGDSSDDVDIDHDGKKHAPMEEGLHMFATLLKMFIGSGVLFLPKSFSNGGWLFSSVMMLVMALITGICIQRLVECRQTVKGSYGYLGQRAARIWGRRAVDVSVVLSQAGFCCVYIIFIARNVLQLLNTSSCWLDGSWLWLIILLEWFLFTPLTFVRNLSSFGPTNLAADALIVGSVIAVFSWCAQGFISAPSGSNLSTVVVFNQSSFALMLGTAIYAFEGVGMVVPVYDSLSEKAQRRFPYTMSATVALVALLYTSFGLVPYLYIVGIQKSTVGDAITMSLPRVWWTYVIQAGYCLALTFSYPLMMHPAMKIMEKGVAPYIFESSSTSLEKRGDSSFHLSQYVRSNIFRSFVVAITLLVALVGSTQLDNFVSLIGCFCCTPLAFIYPCYFHLKLVKNASQSARAVDWAIIIFGVGVFFFSTYEAIAGWSISVIDPCATVKN